MAERASKSGAGSAPEKETWSRSEEAWQKVGAILNAGVIAQVEAKQAETREYLEGVEERLNEIIRQANAETEDDPVQLPDSAAILPTGNVNYEIQRAVGAINLLTDPELKFRLTTFIDDYRRILQQNREPEKAEIVEDLMEYFEKGSLDYVDMEVETKEMIEGLTLVEEEAERSIKLKQEIVERVLEIKSERDAQLATKHPSKEFNRQSLIANTVASMATTVDKKKTPAEMLAETMELINKPNVVHALGNADHALLLYNIDTLTSKMTKKK